MEKKQLPKTSVQVLANRQNGELIAAGEMVDLRFVDRKGQPVPALSLPAGKMLHLLVNHAGPELKRPGQRFRVDLAAVNWAHRTKEDVEAIAHELAGTVVAMNMTLRGKPARRFGAFLSDVILYDEEKNVLEYEFSPLVRTVWQVSNHWASLSARALYAFESAYALRLYEMLCLRENLKHKRAETLHLDDLRNALGVPKDKLLRWVDFKRYALERAIEEVTALSGMIAGYEVKKRGRKVEFVTITWRAKEGPDLDETADRLDMTRQQRLGERRTAIEKELAMKDKAKTEAVKLRQKMEQAEQQDMLGGDSIPF